MGKKKFNDHPFAYRQEIELEITTLTNLGSGLGRVALPVPSASALPPPASSQPPGGWVVMVPFTLPGERVRARVFRNQKNYSEADLVAVLASSPDRVAPGCPLFGTCGGCQYQHLAYPAQLRWKGQQVAELLRHMAGIEFPVAPVIGSPRQYGYRSKITPHFSASRKIGGPSGGDPTGEVAIGFLKQGTRFTLVDVPQCPIATPEINDTLVEVRARTRARLAAGEYKRDATLLLRHAQEGVVTDYDAIIHELVQVSDPQPSTLNPQPGRKAPPLRLSFLARDFFQNNPFILPQFVAYVRDQASAPRVESHPWGGLDPQAAGTRPRFLVDAYCGSGLFALACAPAFEKVAGVEISGSSVRFAQRNAADNGIANAVFLAADAGAIFAGLAFPPGETAVVIDPPRRGCDEQFLRQLFAFAPARVVYVSCDPATQMRDLKEFVAQGYALTAVQPFDLFPQTRHLECVITLERGSTVESPGSRVGSGAG